MKKELTNCDFVEVVTNEMTVQGLVMPSSDDTLLVLKLPSGYNLGIDRKKIKELRVVTKTALSEQKCEETLEGHKHTSAKLLQKPGLPTIAILHTGGTIASEVDYDTGGTIARFTPEDLLRMFPELRDIVNIRSKLIRNMWSEDMRFSHYNLLAKEIEKEVKAGVDGVIITHGTDTLAHTAAALAFALENLPVPVLVVGAQRSSDRGSSDAFMNLVCAAQFLVKSDFCDVGICMHATSEDTYCGIFPATKTRKMHTSRRDAFKPINASLIAKVWSDGKIEKISSYPTKHQRQGLKLIVRPFKDTLKIGLLKAHPHMYVSEFQTYQTFHGLVIEGTGLCNFPLNTIDAETKEHTKIYNFVKKLAQKIPVVIAPQPLYGRVNMNVYSTGRKIKALGILGDYSDMLPETTFIKLAWLLSNHPKDVRSLIGKNLRGELTERNTAEDFHLS